MMMKSVLCLDESWCQKNIYTLILIVKTSLLTFIVIYCLMLIVLLFLELILLGVMKQAEHVNVFYVVYSISLFIRNVFLVGSILFCTFITKF